MNNGARDVEEWPRMGLSSGTPRASVWSTGVRVHVLEYSETNGIRRVAFRCAVGVARGVWAGPPTLSGIDHDVELETDEEGVLAQNAKPSSVESPIIEMCDDAVQCTAQLVQVHEDADTGLFAFGTGEFCSVLGGRSMIGRYRVGTSYDSLICSSIPSLCDRTSVGRLFRYHNGQRMRE